MFMSLLAERASCAQCGRGETPRREPRGRARGGRRCRIGSDRRPSSRTSTLCAAYAYTDAYTLQGSHAACGHVPIAISISHPTHTLQDTLGRYPPLRYNIDVQERAAYHRARLTARSWTGLRKPCSRVEPTQNQKDATQHRFATLIDTR